MKDPENLFGSNFRCSAITAIAMQWSAGKVFCAKQSCCTFDQPMISFTKIIFAPCVVTVFIVSEKKCKNVIRFIYDSLIFQVKTNKKLVVLYSLTNYLLNITTKFF